MLWFLPLFFFAFGTIIGSFLNVLVLRYGARSLFRTRSACGSCGKSLSASELIPLFSFLLQRGRCRGCRSRISWQYPLVELLTGFVFAAIFWKHPFLFLDFSYSRYSVIQLLVIGTELLIWSVLFALSVYDLKHNIIPNGLVYGFAGLALFLFLIKLLQGGFYPLWLFDLFASSFLALFFVLIWLFSRGRAIGLGDAKLIAGFSPLVGGASAVSAVVLGFWIGASVAIFALILKAVIALLPQHVLTGFPVVVRLGGSLRGLKLALKNLTMKSELPLAPFLVVGLFIVYLTGIDVTGLSLLLQPDY